MPSAPQPRRRSARLRLLLIALALAAAGLASALALRAYITRPVLRVASSQSEAWKQRFRAFELPEAPPAPPPISDEELDLEPDTVPAQREAMFKRMQQGLGLDDDSIGKVRVIFEKSRLLSQGNPKTTKHPMKRSACRRIRAEAGLQELVHPRCAAWNMVPLYDPAAGQTELDATACIDQFEFPGVACEYPVVYVRANEAALLCQAIGKRICDAHEWEGACAGAVKPAEQEYAWGTDRIQTAYKHNTGRELRWAYGLEKDHSKCATGSHKNQGCTGAFSECGSNTYPTGAFPSCVSPLGAFDLHGNAAEHMNLPTRIEELASRGQTGSTEMKGSWFIFLSYEAHQDDCRWRAWDWHGTKLMDPESHRNYHLGFRCCKDIGPDASP
jgi:hypothetical protein